MQLTVAGSSADGWLALVKELCMVDSIMGCQEANYRVYKRLIADRYIAARQREGSILRYEVLLHLSGAAAYSLDRSDAASLVGTGHDQRHRAANTWAVTQRLLRLIINEEVRGAA